MHKKHRYLRFILRFIPDLFDFEIVAADWNVDSRPYILIRRCHIITVDGRWNMEGIEYEERFIASPLAAHTAHRAECRKLDIASSLSVRIKDRNARAYVFEIVDKQFAARE